MVLTFLILLIIVLVNEISSDAYHLERQTNILILTGRNNEKIIQFSDIINRTQLLVYMSQTYATTDKVYRTKWHNSAPLSHPNEPPEFKYWTGDCMMKLVGPPMIIQKRVAQTGCNFNSVFKNISLSCIPAWTLTSEDNDVYGYRWGTAWWGAKEEWDPWKFTDTFSFQVENPESPTGVQYPAAGYVAKLSTSPDTSRRVLLDLLFEGKWIDHLTRVVFLHLTLYNANINTLVHLRLVVEHLPYGLHVTRYLTDSVKFQVFGGFWKICVIILLLVLVLIYILRLNHDGLRHFFSSFVHVYQVFLLFLAILLCIYLVMHGNQSTEYVKGFQGRALDSIFYFREMIKYKNISFWLATVLFCCLVIRLLTLLWPLGRQIMDLYKPLKIMSPILCVIFMFCVIALTIYLNITYVLSTFTVITGVFKGLVIIKNTSPYYGIIHNNVALFVIFVEKAYLILALILIVNSVTKRNR